MNKIAEYKILDVIEKTRGSEIYRARKDGTADTVIIKVLKTAYPSPSEIARFKQEYDLIRKVNLEGVIQTYDLLEFESKFALILEDFQGVPLDQVFQDAPPSLDTFLKIAIALSGTLGNLHQSNIVHMDIKPRNILVNPKSHQVKITDFGISTHITRENQEIYNPEIVRGTLAYMSPEQTGRMNRQVDYRTDLYSLGVTLYEILTGILPFIADDPMEIIHSHLAKNPMPPANLNPDIPEPVSDIILKLLAKTAEDRYQNGFGLMADLQHCLDDLKEKGTILPFNLGGRDISLKFTIPQKLYGRDNEIEKLAAAFEQTCCGITNIMFVSGYPGIGKTALINEVQKTIVEKKGFFISGKYEQIRRDVPYSAIILAFQGLIKQLLCQNKEMITKWKQTLIHALSPNASIIAQMMPDITHIIGPQPAITELGAEEFKNRFSIAFKRFMKVFAREEHPLVLFLDDMQWADLASFQLLKSLLSDPDITYLFIIASYRSNEVGPAHPFALLRDEIKNGPLRLQEIELLPLEITDVSRFLLDFLKSPEEEIKPLAEVIYTKTGGNPFFINQFLKTLYDLEKLCATPDIGWQWHIEHIKQLHLTDNVVDLLTEKIVQLPESTRELLKISACIGSTFNFEYLAALLDTPVQVIWADVRSAINEGYIEINDDRIQFQHDRIREAAYFLIPEEKRTEIHYRIGKYALLKNETSDNLPNHLFFITDHLNQAVNHITNRKEKNRLVELNLMAGEKAIYSAAYASALTYLEQGISLLENDAWTAQYKTAMKLHEGAVAAACLGGWYDTMDKYFAIAIQNSNNLLDLGILYEFQIVAKGAQNNLEEAVATGLDILRQLGMTFPEKTRKRHLVSGLIRVKLALKGKTTRDLRNLPEMTDLKILTASRILAKMSTPLFQTDPDLYVLTSFKRLLQAIKYGNTPGAAVSYAAYGVLSCAILEDFDAGYDFGLLALDVLNKFNDSEFRAQIMMMFHGFIRHWKEPAVNSIPSLLEGFQIGKETGKHEHGAYCLFIYGGYLFLVGKPLTELDEIITQNMKAVSKINQTTALNYIKIDKQVISNLREGAPNPGRLAGAYYNEDDMLPIHHNANDRSAIAYLYCHKMYLSFLFDDMEDAVFNAGVMTDYLDGTRSTLNDPRYHLFSALISLRQYRTAHRAGKRYIHKKVRRSLKKLNKYVCHSPANAAYAVDLLTAEYAGVTGNFEKAAIYYDKAIESTMEYGLLQHEALANELAAKFYISRQRLKSAQPYLRDARYKYEQWGALAKVNQIDDLYPDIITTAIPKSITQTDNIQKTSSTLPTIDSSWNLDIATALKASEAIFGEIVLSRLLKRLMGILIENAGAEKGFIILKVHDTFLVEAEGKIGSQEVDVLKSIPIDDHGRLSAAIVTYAARKKEIILLNNAVSQGEFTRDPYVVKNKPKSILCMPILNQGRLSAVLYLENNLAANAFTSERLRLLNLLSSQIAISIDNARLYENLEQKVEERTHQLKIAQEENLRKAHRAGMADIAKETLHNVGNILTSVKTVADTVNRSSSGSALTGLISANKLLKEKLDTLTDFLTHDPKGRKLIDYYFALEDVFSMEKGKTEEQLQRLREKVDEIVRVIQTLQSHIGSDDSYMENVRLKEEIRFVMETKRDALLKSSIEIEEKYSDDIPVIRVQKSKLAHILDNLINNAREAMEYEDAEEKKLTLEVTHRNNKVVIRVRDTGKGISEENLKKIFLHGFTTKIGRYGHNLHNSANNMTEMGGKIHAYSRGRGKGATFTLEFPVHNINYQDQGKRI